MKEFTDAAKRVWNIQLNLSVVKRVRDLTGTDLCQTMCGQRTLAEALLEDYILLGLVLYAVCQRQAEERKITQDVFLSALSDDSIEQAGATFLEELIDFFPRSRRAQAARIHELALQARTYRNSMEAIQSGETSTGSPDAPESIPESTPSVS